MNTYSVLSFIAFLLYIQAGIFILRKSHRKAVNVIFSILCLSLAIFALFSAFIYSAPTVEKVYFYDRLAAIGWTTFPFLMVLFFTKISNNKSKFVTYFAYYVLVPILVISYIFVLYDLENLKFYNSFNQTWLFILNNESVFVYIFIFYLYSSLGLSLYVLIKWYLCSQKNREKKQASIIILSLIIFFLASTFSNILLPLLNVEAVPALAPLNSIVLITGMFYAMIRYQRDVFSTDVISSLLLDRINEFLIFLNNDKNIFTVNEHTLKNLSYTFNEIIGLPINSIVSNNKLVDNLLSQLRNSTTALEISVDFVASKGDLIPVIISGHTIKDNYKNTLGYVLIGVNNKHRIQLRKEVSNRIRKEKKLKKVKEELESLVNKNTKELSEANKKLQIEILERKRAEKQIKHALDEKTKLLSEIHHRVKNNIQIIVSLINMLSSHKNVDNTGSEKLSEIAERVRTISEIHESFYSTKNLSKIDFASFLRKTIEEFSNKFGYENSVNYDLNIYEKFIEINKAIPCGIICYELLDNALKLAFLIDSENNDAHKKQECKLKIDFYKKDGEYTLSFCDIGVGDITKETLLDKNTVSFQMVDFLVKNQLRGKFSVEQSSGTTIILKFN